RVSGALTGILGTLATKNLTQHFPSRFGGHFLDKLLQPDREIIPPVACFFRWGIGPQVPGRHLGKKLLERTPPPVDGRRCDASPHGDRRNGQSRRVALLFKLFNSFENGSLHPGRTPSRPWNHVKCTI